MRQRGSIALEQALSGVRIVDLGIITAGANASQMLADLGADVIKVESASAPDSFRGWQGIRAPGADAPPDPWNWAPTFNMVNRNKRGICLDLKHPRGREIFLQLVAVSDAVVENFRQGVMDRLGLGYDALSRVNPRIVMISIASQGSQGPEAAYGSYGSTLDALSGLMSVTGYEDSHPYWSSETVNYPDQVASEFAAGLLLAAIRQRNRTGRGSYVDLSQRELVTTMVGEQVLQYTAGKGMPQQQGNRRPGVAPNDCYRCAGEDAWVAVSIATDDEWRRFCNAIGRSDLHDDPRFATESARQEHHGALRAIIEDWTTARTKHEAMETLQAAGVRAGAVLTGPEMLQDPQLNARGYYQTVENVRSGTQVLRLAPYHLTATPPTIRAPAPTLGQDTDEVLRDVLGLSERERQELAELGVTANVPTRYQTI